MESANQMKEEKNEIDCQEMVRTSKNEWSPRILQKLVYDLRLYLFQFNVNNMCALTERLGATEFFNIFWRT